MPGQEQWGGFSRPDSVARLTLRPGCGGNTGRDRCPRPCQPGDTSSTRSLTRGCQLRCIANTPKSRRALSPHPSTSGQAGHCSAAHLSSSWPLGRSNPWDEPSSCRTAGTGQGGSSQGPSQLPSHMAHGASAHIPLLRQVTWQSPESGRQGFVFPHRRRGKSWETHFVPEEECRGGPGSPKTSS